MSSSSSLGDLARSFKQSNDQEKFDLLQGLCFLLSSMEDVDCKNCKKQWSVDIRDGLFDLFSNRISSEYLQDALFLSHWMIFHIGGSWAIVKPRFPLLLLQCCRTEICMHLGGYERKSSEITPEDDKPIVISNLQEQQLLVSCYSIIEDTIFNLVDGNPPSWESLPAENLIQIQGILVDIFEAIVQFLMRYENNENLFPFEDPFIFATFRIFALWSAEDPTPYLEQFKTLLPLFLKLKNEVKEYQNIELLLPGLSLIDEPFNTKQKQLLFQHLVQYLKYWTKNNSNTPLLDDPKAEMALRILLDIGSEEPKYQGIIKEFVSKIS